MCLIFGPVVRMSAFLGALQTLFLEYSIGLASPKVILLTLNIQKIWGVNFKWDLSECRFEYQKYIIYVVTEDWNHEINLC